MKKTLFFISCLLAIVLSSLQIKSQSVSADQRAHDLGIPTLDELAGTWIPQELAVNPPSLHNCHNMLIVDKDLTSYFFNPGGWLYNLAAYADPREPSIWKRGHPALKLLIDGIEYQSEELKQGNYRVLRRNEHCNGLSVETDTRLMHQKRGVLLTVKCTNTTLTAKRFKLTMKVPGSIQPDGIGVANEFQRKGVITVVRPTSPPDKIDIDAYIVALWNWHIDLKPGETYTIGFVAGDEDTQLTTTDGFIQGDINHAKGHYIDSCVNMWAKAFNAAFEDCKFQWANRWADAFTVNNSHYSGHAPVLKTTDAALQRNYYMGIFTLLSVERSQFPIYPVSFITNGERDDGTQFYGDLAVLPTLWSLLEPKGMKATLRRWLVQNLRNGAWLDIRQTSGYDTTHYNRMFGYAFNACLFFKTADTYLRVTQDTAFLDEALEDGRTVFQHLNRIAVDWETLPKNKTGLTDFGGNECLLECDPNYTHYVAAMNAQVIYMLRKMAGWLRFKGNPVSAGKMEIQANKLLPIVMQLYKEGEGIWLSYDEKGNKVEIRHCMDYAYAGDALVNDLSRKQKQEMNNFVKSELMTDNWMRAMSLRDSAAAYTYRADHGPYGSYDVWLPLTMHTMWQLGDASSAFDFYRRISAVTLEGSFTQAHEFYGPTYNRKDAPVRISEAWGNMRETSGGGTFAEVVIQTFFGFDPNISGTKILVDPALKRPFKGVLQNVNCHHKNISLQTGEDGIEIK
ncbi:hypothetical protein [Chitinophaga eiseniae]|uniref:Alpha-L-rhamnosidase six-hairpin glycosidase domain-containing protein n=1 Tax=Chitinophaga eiseniae TaxID=634771 RepID=A0A847SQR6_9BACT|nr:hypothetical protein [Chitinophaga eiseniae]NLR79659.1 hypothetical protein [Chitinophaga eiseniae]